MSIRDAEDLREELAREQERLGALNGERERARERIAALRAELETVSRTSATVETTLPRSPGEKVALFRSLFRGRADVFARRWANERKGTAGYAPACLHEWVRDVCEKPHIKCGECPNQAFTSLVDQVVLDHLRGRHVIGLYPLLANETCWFLAADFDKASWHDDVAAFVETCDRFRVPVTVERSRSGEGAHVWCFFEAPVSAPVARQMGCYLLTETMAQHHELSMRSYDRLFPNQDTLPRGGFGNLIALPLQHAAREYGNSVFVDSRWEPHPDQWAHLASSHRMAPSEVESLARQAVERGRVIGVGLAAARTTGTNRRPGFARHPGPLTATLFRRLRRTVFEQSWRAGFSSRRRAFRPHS